jgi:hypothetical protein
MSAPNAPCDDGWFYADGEKPVGPVTIDVVNAVLRSNSDPGKVRVWRTGFPDWRETKDVPEFANHISRPPPRRSCDKGTTKNQRGRTNAASLPVQSFWLLLFD